MSTLSHTKRGRGRPAKFNREQVLNQVMQLFWDQGYRLLSFNQIADATGLTRASLYNAFDSKEALFREVIDHYFSGSVVNDLKSYPMDAPATPALLNCLDEIVTSFAEDDKRRGCLVMNCINELATDQTETGEIMRGYYEDEHALFERLAGQAIAQQELTSPSSAKELADLILAFLFGLSAMAKTGANQADMKRMAHNFLRGLGFTLPNAPV